MGLNIRFVKILLPLLVIFIVCILWKTHSKIETNLECSIGIRSNLSHSTQFSTSINYSSYVFTVGHSVNQYQSVKHNSTFNYNMLVVSRKFFAYLSEKLRNTSYPGIRVYTQYAAAQSQFKPIFRMDLLQRDFSSFSTHVNASFYQAKIRPCQKVINSSSLFVAIISAPNHFEKRVAIRRTWLKHLELKSNLRLLNIGFGFIIGMPESQEILMKIREESVMHGDILQINVVDCYHNLTLKVIGLLKWMNDHCSRVDYMLKVDDDVYVNVQNILNIIRNLNSSEYSVYGSAGDNIPIRDAGKGFISFEDWPWSWYPPFVRGGAVLIPGVTIEPLLAASKTIPFFPFEDVYLSGLCTNQARIKVRFSNRFFGGIKTMYIEPPEPCHVYHYATWLTNSDEHLKKSHSATEDFYNSAEKCIVKRLNGTTQTIDPTNIVDFSFTEWDTLSETLNWAEVIDD